MLGNNAIIAFLPTLDLGKAKHFFQQTLGLKLVSESAVAIEFDAGGTMLRVTRTPEFTAAPYTVLGWRVDDATTAVRALTMKGVVFARYEGVRQDADGVWDSPSGARVAWFKDTDGNTLSLTQPPLPA